MKGFNQLMLVLAVSLLTACGGGGGSSTGGDATVSLLITDAVSDQYAKVWVTVQKVAAVDASGTPFTLYDNPQGEVVNLSELDGVAALLNTQLLPDGTYSDFQVTLANEVTLVERTSGQSVKAAFNNSGQPETVAVQGSVTIAAGSTATIAIDFDLKQFSFDPLSGLVTPVLVLRNDMAGTPPLSSTLARTYADVGGTVGEISGPTAFILQTEHGAAPLMVNLQSTATVYDERNGTLGSDTTVLAPGLRVAVYGNYDTAAMVVDAVRVEIKAATSGNAMYNAKVEGLVSSYDAGNDVLLLDVREADHFMPPATTMEISNVANAVFTKGGPELLAAGQKVEVKGDWADPIFSAALVEIEGALPESATDGSHAYDDPYAEVKGRVESVAGDIVTVAIVKTEDVDPATAPDITIDIDVSKAWFKAGMAPCLQAGSYLEAKGALVAGAMVAAVVEIESTCDDQAVIVDVTPASNDNTMPDGTMTMDGAEIKGAISAIDGDIVTVRLFIAKGFQPGGDEVQVDVANAAFEAGGAADIALQRVVEARGSWNGSQLRAMQLEFK